MSQDGASLLQGDPWEPLDEVGYLRTVFKVFKECDNRNARATEHPSATDATRISLYGRTGGPVEH